MNFSNFLWASFLVFIFRNCRVTAVDPFYTAGVVEFKPFVGEMNSSELLTDHLKSYLNILESAEAEDTDIIVFPEGTLNNALHLTYVPSEKDQIIPCLENEGNLFADFFVQLSCAARKVSKYLVINLTEKDNCSSHAEDPRPCASNNLNIFNTNVVFNREGRVVSRYRKVHVYVENKNTTYKPEFAIFNTDFGVRFGHFICFDILFYTPAQELVDRFHVTDFIFTSLFYSELPFLTAVQLQHGWSWGNNVNLLAAGASYPERGMTGSGIYAGEYGDLVSVMVSEDGVRRLYKARLPKRGTKFIPTAIKDPLEPTRNVTKLHLLKDPQIQNYNSILLDFEHKETHLKKQLCHGDICCSFEVTAKITTDTEDYNGLRYRVGVFDGRRSYEKEEWSDIKVCALYACSNEDSSSCGDPLLTDNIFFKTLHIRGNFPKANKLIIMPSVLNDQLYPLPYNLIQWAKEERDQHYEVNLKLSQELPSLMTFGIYGQYYEKSAAKCMKAKIFCVLLSLLIAINFQC